MTKRFEHDKPFNRPNLIGNLLHNVPSSKGKHAYIHHVWSNNMHVGMRIPYVCFEISFLNKLGCVEDSRYQITGQYFNDMLSNLNILQSKKFVHDATKGNHIQSSRTIDNVSQNSLPLIGRHVGNDDPMGTHDRPLRNHPNNLSQTTNTNDQFSQNSLSFSEINTKKWNVNRCA